MNTSQTTLPLHHRGMYDVINTFNDEQPDFASMLVNRVISTDQLYEEIAAWSGLGPAADVNESEGIPFDTGTVPFQKKFYPTIKAIGFEMSEVAYETDQFGKYKQWAQMFAQSHYVTEQQTAADLINFMIDTGAKHLGMDGKPLVATDHPTRASSWSNRSASDKHLGPLTLEDAVNEMMEQVAYRDYPFPQVGPFDLHVGTKNAGMANRILMTDKLPGSNDNDKNWAGSMLNKVVANPFVTQRYYWLLKAARQNGQGLFRLQRKGLRLREGFDIRSGNMLMTATKVYLYAWSMPNGIWGSPAVLS